MTQTEKLHLITTGGTIDSYYDPDSCSPVCYATSILPGYLEQHCHLSADNYRHTAVCSKDSRDITDQDRQDMLKAVLHSSLNALIITHGSFTVFETARYLQTRLDNAAGKTVILTGALRPIDGFTYSDGLFNLGAAALAAQHAQPGVYVCINGQLFTPEDRDVWH